MDFLLPLWDNIVYNPIVNALLFVYSYVGNYGVAIIIFTIFLALVQMPFRIKQQQAMKIQQEKQARLAPKVEELKKKYKNEPQRLQQEQMKLYQEEGINPISLGCLLGFLPFPIFIAFYQIVTAVMGTAPEQLLNLSSHLYSFFPQAGALVPVNPFFLGLNMAATPTAYGGPYGINPVTVVTILLAAGSTWVSQKLITPATPTTDAQAAQMNSTMQLMMPLMFGFFVINAPIGVSVYWITNGLVSIVQQLFTGGVSSLRNLLPGSGPKKAPVKRPRIAIVDTEADEEPAARPRTVPTGVERREARPAVSKAKPLPGKRGVMYESTDDEEETATAPSAPETPAVEPDQRRPAETKPVIVGPRRGKKKRANKH